MSFKLLYSNLCTIVAIRQFVFMKNRIIINNIALNTCVSEYGSILHQILEYITNKYVYIVLGSWAVRGFTNIVALSGCVHFIIENLGCG